jgi:hypothetical protein
MHSTSILGQVLKLMPRAHIESLDKTYSTGRPSRVLSRWSQVGALVFAQLAGRHSLRDVVTAMASQSDALAPLGVSPPKRSTLAEANERRPAALYQSLFATLYARCQAVAPGHGLRFKNPLLSLDSTTISLGLNLFPWAHFRTAKGAIKVHTLLDHAGHLPAVVVMTAGKGSDIAMARGLQLPKGSIVAMDRGYIDYRFLFRLTQDGVYFVTRQKINAKGQVTARFAVNWLQGVTSDQHVVLRGQNSHAYPDALRRVGYRDPETGNHYVFWTTAFHLAAATIAAIYKARWQIEVCQTQPVKMTWCPLRHAPWAISGLRGTLKREYVVDIHWLPGDDDFPDQALRDGLTFFKGQPVQVVTQQAPKGFGMLNDLLPMPRLLLGAG